MKIKHYEKCSWRCTSSCMWLAAITHWSGETNPLLLQNLLAIKQVGKHPRNSLSSCCWSLLLRISVPEAKSLSQLRKRHDYLIRLRLKRHISFNSLCPGSWTFVELDFLIMDDQQLEDIFSISHKNLRPRLHILFLGTDDVRRDDVN